MRRFDVTVGLIDPSVKATIDKLMEGDTIRILWASSQFYTSKDRFTTKYWPVVEAIFGVDVSGADVVANENQMLAETIEDVSVGQEDRVAEVQREFGIPTKDEAAARARAYGRLADQIRRGKSVSDKVQIFYHGDQRTKAYWGFRNDAPISVIATSELNLAYTFLEQYPFGVLVIDPMHVRHRNYRYRSEEVPVKLPDHEREYPDVWPTHAGLSFIEQTDGRVPIVVYSIINPRDPWLEELCKDMGVGEFMYDQEVGIEPKVVAARILSQ